MSKRQDALKIIQQKFQLKNANEMANFLMTDTATVLFIKNNNAFPPNIDKDYLYLLAVRIARNANVHVKHIAEKTSYGVRVNKNRMEAFKDLLFHTKWHTIAKFARLNGFDYYKLRKAINGDFNSCGVTPELLNDALVVLGSSLEEFEILSNRKAEGDE